MTRRAAVAAAREDIGDGLAPEAPEAQQPETAPTPNATDHLVREVRYLLRARNHLIWVSTEEERRAERIIATAAAKEHYLVRFWDCGAGARDLEGKKVEIGDGGTPETHFAAVLDKVRGSLPLKLKDRLSVAEWGALSEGEKAHYTSHGGEYVLRPTAGERAVWILRDLHDWLTPDQFQLVRSLKTLVRDLQEVGPSHKSRFNVIVILSPNEDVPVNLRNLATHMAWPLPERAEVRETLESILQISPRRQLREGDGSDRMETLAEVQERLLSVGAGSVAERLDAAVDAAMGLTLDQASSSFSMSIVRHKLLDPAVIAAEKKTLVSKVPGLTWYPPDPRGMAAIGGLDLLKEELLDMRTALAPEAREYGLQAPRGILLAGPPGCGKSLTAKACAEAFRIPLLKLDLGAMKGSLMGQSEGNIRRALRTIEAIGTCVVWVDEIDRSLPAPGAYEGDSGVGKDQVGTLLNFLQEHKGFIFLVATTNEPTRLGPELTRAGRFNATFFCDLPNLDERGEVLAVSLAALPKPRDPECFDLRAVARATPEFSGAELASIASTALRKAFRAGREVATADLLAAAAETIPLARSAAQRLAQLREWARDRARPASCPPINQSASVQRGPLRLEFEEEDIQ